MSARLARLGWTLAALASHWRRNPLQLAAVLAGLMVATALWSGVQALNAEARQSYAEAAALLDADEADRLEPVAEGRLDRALYVELRRAGWPVSPVIEGRVRVAERSLQVLGIEPLTIPQGTVTAAFAGGPGIAEFTAPPWVMLANPRTLERIGARRDAPPETAAGRRLPEATAAETLTPGVLVMDIGAAEALLGADAALTALLIDPARPRPDTDWREIAGDSLRLVEAGGESDLDRLTDSFHLNLTAFGVLAFAVGLFITHSAVGLAFEQRLGVMRTLRACGVSAADLTLVLLGELVAAALLAGAAGLAAGYVLAAALLPDVAATLRGLYGANVTEGLSLAPEWWAAGLGMSLLGALIAAGHTLGRAWTMPPLASARRQAWRAAQLRTLRWQAGLAVLALGAALALLRGAEGLLAGFGAMAGMLLGATLLLPVVLSGLLAGAGRLARGPLAEWAVADGRQQLSGLGLALMALLLALAANIGVGTMVESFRTTFVDWLDRRLFADVYLDAGAEAREVEAWLDGRGDVAATLYTRSTEAVLDGLPVGITGRPDAPAYRESWPFLSALPDPWDRIAAGEGAMVSEQLARRLGLGLGDRLALPAPGGPWRLEVAAIFADYGNPKGAVGVGLEALERRWPGAARDGTSVMLREGASADALIAALGARFDIPPDRVVDNAALKEFSLGVFERTFAVTAMLNVLTLGVAGIALFISLATLADLRLTQLAPLWAIGVTRRRLALLDMGKTVGLAGLTGIVAIPFGLGVAWLLVAVVNVEAFGWRLPFHVFPLQWLWLLGLTLVVAAAASALPMLRLARMPPARLVKIFAEER